jgi:hypothetical protein
MTQAHSPTDVKQTAPNTPKRRALLLRGLHILGAALLLGAYAPMGTQQPLPAAQAEPISAYFTEPPKPNYFAPTPVMPSRKPSPSPTPKSLFEQLNVKPGGNIFGPASPVPAHKAQ